MSTSRAASIHWFRKGLRIHDNPSLLAACRSPQTKVYPIFILDPHFLKPELIGGVRIKFLLESLACLDENLKTYKSRLILLQGKPETVIPALITAWQPSEFTFESDTEPYAKVRDSRVTQLLQDQGVAVHSEISHTIYNPEEVIQRNQGSCPLTMTRFQKLVENIQQPLPIMPDESEEIKAKLGALQNTPSQSDTTKELAKLGVHEYDAIPTLAELGYPEPSDKGKGLVFPGGENEGLQRLEKKLRNEQYVCTFEKPKTIPSKYLEPHTTGLSPYLKFGCISARYFAHRLNQIYSRSNGKHTKPPVSLMGQLLWREFFYTCSVGMKNFEKMEDNPHCKQIPWRVIPKSDVQKTHPQCSAMRETASTPDKVEPLEALKAWEQGRTGFPWIDACMIQLRETGFLHHLARHCVACFLTRGDLYIHWEHGRDVFDKYLIDSDYALNNANWQWLSCSTFFAQYFRVYSPMAFPRKTDPNGDFVRYWIPELQKIPAKFIYEPWDAPLSTQKAAGCIIGKDYPKPIVDHKTASKWCIEQMSKAYKASKTGDEEEILQSSDYKSPQELSPDAIHNIYGEHPKRSLEPDTQPCSSSKRQR